MDQQERSMWEAMRDNPLKTHLGIIVSGGKKALFEFVKNMAISHKICLDVKPRSPNAVQRWKDLSRCMLKDVLDSEPSDSGAMPTEPYISRLIYEAHVRSAYQRCDDVIVRATIVNEEKLDRSTRSALRKMVDSYNKHVVDVAKKRGARLSSFPALAGWNKELAR